MKYAMLEDLKKNGGNLPGVYKITRISDGKIYIGQSDNIVARLYEHINNSKASGGIDAAIKKDGVDNFKFEIQIALPEATTAQLWHLEQYYINLYDSCTSGFNKTIGNHVGAYALADYRKKNTVTETFTKLIAGQFNIVFNKGMKILLIHDFNDAFIDYLRYTGCEVTIINKYTEDSDELGNYIMEELDKVASIKFDLIIANPPYGKIGANITKKIIDTIDFKEYINLLPANDYRRNDTKDLYKYVNIRTMKPVNDAFADAAVTTHMAEISKEPCEYISWDEFQIENYTDKSLKKYFYNNLKRTHYAIDIMPVCGLTVKNAGIWDIHKTFIIGYRDMNHKHLPYTKDCTPYKWNIEESIDMQYIIDTKPKSTEQLVISQCQFNTEIEKKNFVKFIYSTDGFRFMSKVFTALNCDARVEHNAFPKVDWTRSWTVEEILKDYGYSDKEVKEVMDDLVNFKGMDD